MITLLAVDSRNLLCVHSAREFHGLAVCSLCLLRIPWACHVFTLLAVDSMQWKFSLISCRLVVPYFNCFGACLTPPPLPHTPDAEQIATCTWKTNYLCLHCIFIQLLCSNCDIHVGDLTATQYHCIQRNLIPISLHHFSVDAPENSPKIDWER